MSTPYVSVILPTFNRANLLDRAVQSVLRQTFKDFELIIVDDGSTDDTIKLVESYEDNRIVFAPHKYNQGVSAARNTGITVARSELIAFQDSDDEWLPEKLERQVKAIKNSNCEMVLCTLVRTNQSGIFRFPTPELMVSPNIFSTALELHPYGFPQTWLVKKELLELAGLFDVSLSIWEDWDLLLRLSKLTKVYQIGDVLVKSFQTPDSLSQDYSSRVAAIKYIEGKYSLMSGQSKAFRARLAYLVGRLTLLSGDNSLGRKALLKAIRIKPFAVKPWVLLLISFFNKSFVYRLVKVL